MKTTDYLDAAKDLLCIKSDYALSKMLGISLSRMSSYRTGRRYFDDDACIKIGESLKINPISVLADANTERAKTPELRAHWQQVAARYA